LWTPGAVAILMAVLRRILTLPFTVTPWKDFVYLQLGLVWGCVGLTLLFVGPVTAAILAVLIIGIPYALASFYATRWWGDVERRRASLVLGAPIPKPVRHWDGRLLERIRAALADPMSWREIIWMPLLFAIGLGFQIAATTVIFTALGVLVGPLWMWSIPDGIDWGVIVIDTTWEAIAVAVLLGPPLLVLAVWLQRGLALGQAHLARVMLQPDEQQRIAELETRRTGAVDAAATELRRIERDLHDGAQARLVALAMDLGLARERMASDPAAAAALIEGAHEDAKTALVELRDLARGIHPAILTDRGLDAAVSALAARCPVPCTVDVDLARRPPAAVESAAYFTSAEALANVAKHSGARLCAITAREQRGRIVVEVRDDGRGGADPDRGTGLAGLRGRVEALDGVLTVTSPPGGGTLLRAELPCAS
jgi:signal transduction histidine kinase